MAQMAADGRQGVDSGRTGSIRTVLAVDPNYDGQVFRSVWQDYRGNTANDADELRVVTHASLTLPAKPGPRRVCVRVVDVFGFEAEVVATVGAA